MAIADAVPVNAVDEVVVVTGRALDEPLADSLLDVIQVDRVQLETSPARRLETILDQAAGLKTFRRSDSSIGHPTSQGVTLRGLGGNASNRALLILDGVPQSDPFGGWTNWPAFNVSSLAGIRVTRGGGSIAHGPGALAGTIEASSSLDDGIAASLEAGSRRTVDAGFSAGIPVGLGRLGIAVQGAQSDGFVPIDKADRGPADQRAPYRQANGRIRWITPVASNVELQASLSAFLDERERGLDFTENRTRGSDASLRLVGRGDWQWSALAYGQWRNFRSSFAAVDDGRSTARRVSLQDHVPSSAYGAGFEVRPPFGHAAELRIGADARAMNGHSHEFSTYVEGEATRERDSGGNAMHAGLFSELSWAPKPWTFSLAARLDYWRIGDGRLEERNLVSGATSGERYTDRHGWEPTARAAAGLKVTDGLQLRAAAYLGWRLPTLNELFRPFRAGPDATAANALLDPERLGGIEGGMRWEPARHLSIDVTLFANRLKDAIANVTLGQGPGTFPGVGFVAGDYRQRQNLNAITSRGIEARVDWRTGPWRLQASYGFADAEVETSPPAAALDGKRPAQTPRHWASTSIGWQKGRADLTVQGRFTGTQFEDDLNELKMPSAFTVDVFAGWRLGPKFQLVFRGENIFDERVVAGISSDGLVERATPRTIWIGLRFDDTDDQ